MSGIYGKARKYERVGRMAKWAEENLPDVCPYCGSKQARAKANKVVCMGCKRVLAKYGEVFAPVAAPVPAPAVEKKQGFLSRLLKGG